MFTGFLTPHLPQGTPDTPTPDLASARILLRRFCWNPHLLSHLSLSDEAAATAPSETWLPCDRRRRRRHSLVSALNAAGRRSRAPHR